MKLLFMSWNDLVYGTADLFQWGFSCLESLGMLPNMIFFTIGFVAFAWWVLQMRKHAQSGNA